MASTGSSYSSDMWPSRSLPVFEGSDAASEDQMVAVKEDENRSSAVIDNAVSPSKKA